MKITEKCGICEEIREVICNTTYIRKPGDKIPVVTCDNCFSILWNNMKEKRLRNEKEERNTIKLTMWEK